MKNSYENRERNKKNNEVYLYNLGFDYIEENDKAIDDLISSHSEVEVPESLDQWFDHFQKENEKKNTSSHRLLRFKKSFKKIAAIFAILLLANGILMVRVDAYKIVVMNMILDTKEKFTQMKNLDTTNDRIDLVLPDDWNSYLYPVYVPIGYTLSSFDTTNNIKTMEFTGEDNHAFFIIQSTNTLEHQLDTENARVIDVEINQHQGKLIIKDDRSIITWNLDDKNIILAGTIDQSTIIKIAENLTVKIKK